MQKRTSRGAISSPTAAEAFGANIGAEELHAWANQPGMPDEVHTPQATAKSNALAEPRHAFAPAQPRGPLALGSPGRDRIRQALDMREARADDEGTPHNSPLALGSPGRDRIRQALDVRNAREDDEPPPPKAFANLQRRQARQADHTSAPPMSPRETTAFNQAYQHFEASHLQSHADAKPQQPGGPSGKPRGFQIHKVQAAAQRAKGNQYTGPDDDGSD